MGPEATFSIDISSPTTDEQGPSEDALRDRLFKVIQQVRNLHHVLSA